MPHRKKGKKVLLFIVEGSNDEVALGMPLENLQNKYAPDDMIMFGVTHGDITSDFKVKKAADEVVKCVKKYCKDYKLTKDDIHMIVLLLDMDGAYIPASSIVKSDEHDKAFYGESTILHKCPDDLRKTHSHKQKQVNSLLNIKHVWGNIPFNAYFVACNFDHVISGNANITSREKRNAADAFSLEYGKDADGFINFFNRSCFILGDSLKTSWDIVRQDLNSLKRCSNMNVFINAHYYFGKITD